MRIKWYGTASLLLESGGTKLLFDPYLKNHNKKLFRLPLAETAEADAIVITHPHFDHFGNIDAFTEGGTKPVYVSAHGIELARRHGFNTSSMRAIGANEEFSVGCFKIRTYQSRHCKFDAITVLGVAFSPRTYVQIGRAIKLLKENRSFKLDGDIYAFEVTDGIKTAVILGSAGMDAAVEYPKGADLFVFPYQGRSGMHQYVKKFLPAFKPKKVFLDHFDNSFPPLTHLVKTAKCPQSVKEILPETETVIPVENEWYEV